MKSFAIQIMVPDTEVPGRMMRTFRVLQFQSPDHVSSAQIAAFVASRQFMEDHAPSDLPDGAFFQVVDFANCGMIRISTKFESLPENFKHDAVIAARAGGHFMSALAEAYSRADKGNRQKLEEAFGESFMKYAKCDLMMPFWSKTPQPEN